MDNKESIIMCCFCGEHVDFKEAIFINIIVDKETNDAQTLYAHYKCLDKVLNHSVPRYFDEK